MESYDDPEYEFLCDKARMELPAYLERLYLECPHARDNHLITLSLMINRKCDPFLMKAFNESYFEEQRLMQEAAEAMMTEEEREALQTERVVEVVKAIGDAYTKQYGKTDE